MWQRLLEELQIWSERRPRAFRPIKIILGSPATNQFPKLLYAHWAAISGNQLFHTACLLMLDAKPDGTTPDGESAANSPVWHARKIVGISLTNLHQGCLNNAIQPLWIAGKLFTHHEELRVRRAGHQVQNRWQSLRCPISGAGAIVVTLKD